MAVSISPEDWSEYLKVSLIEDERVTSYRAAAEVLDESLEQPEVCEKIAYTYKACSINSEDAQEAASLHIALAREMLKFNIFPGNIFTEDDYRFMITGLGFECDFQRNKVSFTPIQPLFFQRDYLFKHLLTLGYAMNGLLATNYLELTERNDPNFSVDPGDILEEPGNNFEFDRGASIPELLSTFSDYETALLRLMVASDRMTFAERRGHLKTVQVLRLIEQALGIKRNKGVRLIDKGLGDETGTLASVFPFNEGTSLKSEIAANLDPGNLVVAIYEDPEIGRINAIHVYRVEELMDLTQKELQNLWEKAGKSGTLGPMNLTPEFFAELALEHGPPVKLDVLFELDSFGQFPYKSEGSFNLWQWKIGANQDYDGIARREWGEPRPVTTFVEGLTPAFPDPFRTTFRVDDNTRGDIEKAWLVNMSDIRLRALAIYPG
jgi:hypothetical protein